MFKFVLFGLLAFTLVKRGYAIGCYECTSGGGQPYDSSCEKGGYYASSIKNCQPREGGQAGPGVQPYCVKVDGTMAGANGQQVRIVTRGCSTLQRNECKNDILFNQMTINGCIKSCRDKDYCNAGHAPAISAIAVVIATLMAFAGVKLIN